MQPGRDTTNHGCVGDRAWENYRGYDLAHKAEADWKILGRTPKHNHPLLRQAGVAFLEKSQEPADQQAKEDHGDHWGWLGIWSLTTSHGGPVGGFVSASQHSLVSMGDEHMATWGLIWHEDLATEIRALVRVGQEKASHLWWHHHGAGPILRKPSLCAPFPKYEDPCKELMYKYVPVFSTQSRKSEMGSRNKILFINS